MVDGIAKTAESVEPSSPITHTSVAEGIDAICYEQVPIDVYKFFNAPLGSMEAKEVSELKEISDWAFQGQSTLGDGMQKMRSLEIELGQPTGDERRHDKMLRWIKMQRQIEDLVKRQGAL